MANIELNEIVNVVITATPRALDISNPNNLLILTKTQASDSSAFSRHINSNTIATLFGSSSLVKRMADNIFSQSPNILSGGGELIVGSLLTNTDATQGKFTTGTIASAISTNFGSITNGSFKITVDGGTQQEITGLNFTGVTDLAGVQSVIATALPSKVSVAVLGSTLVFESKKDGTGSTVALAVGTTGTNIAGSTGLNISAGTAVAGTNKGGETLSDAVTRLQGVGASFSAIITDAILEGDKVKANATVFQTSKLIYFAPFDSTDEIANAIKDIKDAGQSYARCLLYTASTEESILFASAYAGRALSVNFNGVSTAQTLNLKNLVNVVADVGLSSTNALLAKKQGADTYGNLQSGGSIEGSGDNRFFDQVYLGRWLEKAMQIAVINVLKTINTKISQTQEGITSLRSAVKTILEQAKRIEYLTAGLKWNSSQTFGNPEDFRRNITDVGYYIYNIPIADQSQADREARKAPVLQVATKEAGGINSAEILILIEA